MEGLILLIAIVIIAVYLLAATEFQEIARMKGHNESKYFWWCFLTGAIGWLMVVALPDRDNTSVEGSAPAADELPNL